MKLKLHILNVIKLNSPVVIIFTLISITVLIADIYTDNKLAINFFTSAPEFNPYSPLSYFKLVSYILGHRDWMHLQLNLIIILAAGPLLEEKYGSKALLAMILITALVKSILDLIFSLPPVRGASGIAFMFITLASFANLKECKIPFTFVIIFFLFFFREFEKMFNNDNISHSAHLLGGACGFIFGFYLIKKDKKEVTIATQANN